MLGVDPARLGGRGVCLDSPVTQLFRKALAVAEEVIPVRMEAASVVIPTGESQVDMGVFAIDVERRYPGSVRKFCPRKVQRRVL